MSNQMMTDYDGQLPRLVPRLYRKMTYTPRAVHRFLRPLPSRFVTRARQTYELDPRTQRAILRRVQKRLRQEKMRPRVQVDDSDNSEEFCYKYGNYPQFEDGQLKNTFQNDSSSDSNSSSEDEQDISDDCDQINGKSV